MAKTVNYIPIRTTRAYRDAQSDENFLGWLRMQEAVMDIEFPYVDCPEVRDVMYAKESLPIVEAKLLQLYGNSREALTGEENLHRTMRFVYYVGDVFRRAFEGTWVALPEIDDKGKRKEPEAGPSLQPAVDVPFRESFVTPLRQVSMAIGHRSGNELATNFLLTERAYAKWVKDGRGEVVIRGTLREKD